MFLVNIVIVEVGDRPLSKVTKCLLRRGLIMSRENNTNSNATVNKLPINDMFVEMVSNECMLSFAATCAAKNRVKDFLQGFKGGKFVEPFFSDEEFIDELLGHGKLLENFYTVLFDVFKEYKSKLGNLQREKKMPQVKGRTKLLRDLVVERLAEVPGDKISEELGDFMKTNSGAKYEAALVSEGLTEDDLYDNIVVIAVRSILKRVSEVATDKHPRTVIVPICDTVPEATGATNDADVEKEVEVISDIEVIDSVPESTGAAHNKTIDSEKEEIVVCESDFESKLREFIDQLIDKPDDEVKRGIVILLNQILGNDDIRGELLKMVGGEFKSSAPNSSVMQVLLDTLPEDHQEMVGGVSLKDVASLLAGLYHDDDFSEEDIEGRHTTWVVFLGIYYSIIDALLGNADTIIDLTFPIIKDKLNGTEENKFMRYVPHIMKYIDCIDIVDYIDQINKQIEIPKVRKTALSGFTNIGSKALLRTMTRNFKKFMMSQSA